MRLLARRLRVLLLPALTASCATDRLAPQGVTAFEQGAYEESIAMLEQAVAQGPLQPRAPPASCARAGRRPCSGSSPPPTRARANGERRGAATSYRRVLALEPGNDRALRGLEGVRGRPAARGAHRQGGAAVRREEARRRRARGAAPCWPRIRASRRRSALVSKIDLARGPTSAVPRLKTHDDRPVSLQFRDAPTKMVFEVLARQTGLNFVFDKDVKSEGKTTIFVNQVPVEHGDRPDPGAEPARLAGAVGEPRR